MGITKRTKEERAEYARNNRPDTPLAATPEPITNVEGVIADVNKRAAERKAASDAAQKKLQESRRERSKDRKIIAGEGGKLTGLASLKNTLGRQYYKQQDSENS